MASGRIFGRGLLLATTLASGWQTAAMAQSAAPMAYKSLAERFGALEGVQQISLSPDGTQIAFIAPGPKSADDLFIVPVDASTPPKRVLRASGEPENLHWCRWVTDARLVCQLGGRIKGDTGNILGFRSMIGINRDGTEVKSLGVRRSVDALYNDLRGASVIDWSGGAPGSVLMTRSYVPEARLGSNVASRDEGLGVDRVDAVSGASSRVSAPERDAVEYITDGRGTLRLMGLQPLVGQTFNISSTVRYSHRPAAGGRWQSLTTYDVTTDEGFNPYTVDAATDRAVGFTKIDGRMAAATLALDGSAKVDILFAHPEVDVDGLIRVGRDQRVVGVSFVTEKRTAMMTDPKVKAMASALGRALGGKSVYFVDASADESRWLIWAGSDTDPGRYYLYVPAAKQLRPLLDERPQLADVTLSSVQPIRYAAADGTMVPGYLTLPPGRSDAKGLPAIVMPHGGPGARDEWGFDWLAQYLAQSGYAVVQPNFRGSSGYGDAWYQQNGFQSWRTAVGDIADAGRWMVSQGADPAKLSIVGWSYGGYAALQSGVLAPDLFRSIVAIAPVTDLAAMKTEADKWITSRMVRDFIGSGPHIREGSPAQNAKSIMAPVLMFHGDWDQNVAIEQARIMRRALTSEGKRVELIEFSGLAHNLDDPAARAAMLERMTAFLPK